MHALQVIPPGADACDDAGRPVETPRYAAGTPFQHRPMAAMHVAGGDPDAELVLIGAVTFCLITGTPQLWEAIQGSSQHRRTIEPAPL